MGVDRDVVEMRDLTKHYGDRLAVEHVHLSIGPGQLFGFLGPNGSGKTTTIRLMLGLLRPTAGSVRVLGRDCWRDGPRVRREMGYLAGDLRLYWWFTLASAVRIVGRIRGVDLRGPARDLAQRLELEADLPVHRMSRGTRQKLGLILAMAHRPRLLVLDEPTTGLDPLIQRRLAHCLRELAAEGSTIFFSSHTLSEVEQLCDRVAIVRRGKIMADESLDTLRRRAPRRVRIVFRNRQAAQEIIPPDFLSLERRSESEWSATFRGSATELVRWANQLPLQDLSISDPDLEQVFYQFYEESGSI